MAQAIETRDDRVSAVLCLSADCVANRTAGEVGGDMPVWTRSSADVPAFAPAAAWA